MSPKKIHLFTVGPLKSSYTHPQNVDCQHPKLVNPLVPACYEDIYTKTLPYNCLPRQAHIWPRGNTINTGALWLVRTPFSFNPNTRLAKQIEIAVAKYLRHWRLKNKSTYRRISINHLIFVHLLVFVISLLHRSSTYILWSIFFHCTCIKGKYSIHVSGISKVSTITYRITEKIWKNGRKTRVIPKRPANQEQ